MEIGRERQPRYPETAGDKTHRAVLVKHHNQLPPDETLDIAVNDNHALVREDVRIPIPDCTFVHLVPCSVKQSTY